MKRSPAPPGMLPPPPPTSSSLRTFFSTFLCDFFFLPSSWDWEPTVSLSSLAAARAEGRSGGVDSRWSLQPRPRESDGPSATGSPRLSPPLLRSPRGSGSSWRPRASLLSPAPLRSSSFQWAGFSSDAAALGGERSGGSWGRTTWLSKRFLSAPANSHILVVLRGFDSRPLIFASSRSNSLFPQSKTFLVCICSYSAPTNTSVSWQKRIPLLSGGCRHTGVGRRG